jgi:transcriptional regulator with XRE-family HTH domain
MPTEFKRNVTVYVRYRLIGVATEEVKSFADRWGVSKATITDIRLGNKNVGGEVLRKIAEADFGGSVDRLQAEANAFALENPDLIDPSVPLLQRAVGYLTLENVSGAPALVGAYPTVRGAIKNPDALTFESAVALLRTVVSSGESPLLRTADPEKDPPSGADLKNRNQRSLKRRKASG